MKVNIVQIISIITVFQLLLLSIVIITSKKRNKTKHNFLVAFLIVNALYILHFLLTDVEILKFDSYLPLDMILSTLYVIAAQLLYFYIKSLGRSYYKISKIDFFHLLPLTLLTLYSFIIHHSGLFRNYPETLTNIFWSAIHFTILCYIIRTAFIVKKFRDELRNTNSYSKRINLTWLKFILFMFAIMWFADVYVYLILLGLIPNRPRVIIDILTAFSLTVNFIFAVVIVYKGLKQSNVFSKYEINLMQNKVELSPSQIDIYIEKLHQVMNGKKPYLEPLLTIKDLAEKMSVPVRHLSRVINEKFNQNFFDFINTYRIEEAKHLLADPQYKKMNILEILYKVGFNSKSSFNDLFKKKTGVTPSTYRKMNYLHQS